MARSDSSLEVELEQLGGEWIEGEAGLEAVAWGG